MRRTIALLATMALTLLVASGLALTAGVGFAVADSSVVGPGESIQKAISAADPGDTIVVRGLHHEDVIIRKNGIKLRGIDGAVIETPAGAKADSLCSRVSKPTAICVLGDVHLEPGELEITGPRVSDVSVSGFTIRGLKDKGGLRIDATYTRNTTVVGNRVIGGAAQGIGVAGSINTTVAKNHVIGGPSPEPDEEGLVVEFSSRTTVVKNVFRGYDDSGMDVDVSTNTTIEGNDFIGNRLGVLVFESTGTKILSNDITDSTLVGTLILDSTGTKILSNDIRRSGDTGIAMFGPERANNDAKVVGNRISGGPWGIYVERAHGGSFTGNQVHDNCAGMFFVASESQPVGGFEVKGNTVEDNTRSCRAAQFGINFSGIGIALLGASGMEVTANHLSGNVPSGPTRVSGGVVVSTNPYFGGSAKPRNNSVTGNHFGRNKPDIFWDKSGTGNVFRANYCDTSVPTSLCN
jgi:parallel beta-helix repeat protein